MSEQVGDPVDESAERPLVSFVLFVCNHERYIVEGLNAALPLTYPPLEITISDDSR